MDLYKEILIKILEKENIEIYFPNLINTPVEIVESECYKILKKIKEIIEDDTLEDKECFMRIERIVNLFEEMGSGCGTRHDF